jgi:HK97 gp10 family phage protein
MSLKVSFDVKQFTKDMEEMQNKVKEVLGDGVRDATLYMHNKVKESIARGINAPVTVDTGRFLSSVDFNPVGAYEAKVYTDLEYAKYLEYGTSKMDARPHFRNTAKVEKASIKDLFAAKIKMIKK